jgi:outer membrane protein insertion porin family
MKKILIFALLSFFMIDEASSQIRQRSERSSSGDISYSNPKKYVIGDIEVTGLNILDENALISLTGLKIGDEISIPGDEISNAIRKLWKHGLVGDVDIIIDRIEGNEVFLLIELAERPRLTEFTFEGVKKSQESELRDKLNLIRGRILTDAIIRNAQLTVKNHYVEKGYLNAEVNIIQQMDTLNTDGMTLKIVVDTKGKVKIENIYVEGNNNFSDSKLKSRMKNTNERVRVNIFRDLASFIARPSKIKGWVANSEPTSWNEVKEYVNENIKLNFFNGSKFTRSDFEVDKQAIVDFYNSKGFRDATIVEDEVIFNDNNTIDIALTVEEGSEYYFRDIIWSGNYVHSDATLRKILDINKGDIYNKELMSKKLTFNPKGPDISGLYMDDGYLFFNINPVEIAVEGDSIDIEMRIYEGEQATIDEVIIVGNERTRDHVIRRELMTIPGQKFSRSDIIRTQQTLGQLGYFDPASINPVPIPNPADGTVDIEWQVEERSSDQIELSGGWGGYFGFVGTLGLTLNNFSVKSLMEGKFTPVPMGDGQRLSLRAQANGRQYQNYSFSFTEPWMGGKKPNSFTISYNNSVLRTRTYDEDGFLPPFGQYNGSLNLHSFSIGLGRRLEWPDNYFVINNSLGYTIYDLENYRAQGLGFANGAANSITLNTTIARRSTNNPMFPAQGSEISLSLALTPPHSLWRDVDQSAPNAEKYEWIEYHKWMFDAKYYIPLNEKLVIETKAHLGFIGSYGDQADIGPFERFYLGGDGLAGQNFLLGTDIISMRGYENNAITPPYNEIPVDNPIRGGVVYNKFGLELRQAVTTGQAATIYGFLFVEGGNNWNNYQDFNPFNLYRSAGFGARIFMPAFGLIGLNWGYGFDTLPGMAEKSGGHFHFTIGQQIR